MSEAHLALALSKGIGWKSCGSAKAFIPQVLCHLLTVAPPRKRFDFSHSTMTMSPGRNDWFGIGLGIEFRADAFGIISCKTRKLLLFLLPLPYFIEGRSQSLPKCHDVL